MINSKNQNRTNGFTFVEVIIAVAIIGMVLTSLFTLQTGLFNSTFNNYSKISRIFFIKNFFFNFETREKLNKNKIIKKELKDPPTKLTFELKNLNEKSAVKKYENIFLLKSSASWRGLINQQEENMIYFIYEKLKEK